MQIRAYQPKDEQACLAIFQSNVPQFFAAEEVKEFTHWLVSLAHREEAQYYYVVEKEQRVIACGGFYLPAGESSATMVWGMVEREWHGQGIGRALLVYRITQINLLNPTGSIALDTTQHAFEFFRKLGFTVTHTTKDYYAKGLDRYDMVRSPRSDTDR